MKTWLRVHRYLGAFCAPMVIFFAVSGSWQVMNFHKTKKDGSYTAPKALALASDLHMAEDLGGPARWAYRGMLWLVAACLVTTSSIGLTMAFRFSPRKIRVWACVAAGAVLPVLLYILARR